MENGTSIQAATAGTYGSRSRALWMGLALYGLSILYVNPIRETSLDDDWVYGLMVRDLLTTGHYQPHAWSAANLPFQTYYGGLFAKLFGYSFISLRFSTLVLTMFGLAAFYGFAREHRLKDSAAGLSMLTLIASPLVFRYSVNFHTDTQFLMWLIIALLFYTRAIRLRLYSLMALASVAAAAAILTRQFGLALPAGVFALFALHRDERKHPFFYAAGLLLPSLAGVWQLSLGVSSPTAVQLRELNSNALYVSNVWTLLVNAALFRPTVILHYLALFSLPLAISACVVMGVRMTRRERRVDRTTSSASRWLPGVFAVYVLAGIAYGRVVQGLSRLMPYIFWEFANTSALERVAMTLLTIPGAIVYATIFARRYFPIGNWRRVPASERLLDLVALFLLVQQLIYYKFGDRYLIVFLPFALIVVARYVQDELDRFRIVVAIACTAMLIASAMWARTMLATNEAVWTASEQIRARGVEPRQIFGSWEWNLYQGALGDYLSDVGAAEFPATLGDYWQRWTPERMRRAQFVVHTSVPVPGADIVADVTYRDALFRTQHVYVVKGSVATP